MTPFQAVVLVGSITTLYTVFGGMKAVLWTDVMQFFVLVGGIVAMVIAVLIPFGGNVAEVWRIASAEGHTRMFNFSLDPTLEITVWGLILGMLVINLSAYGSDQVIVQRYFTTRDRKQMTRAIMFNGLLTVPVVLALYFVGLGFAAYYTVNPEMRQGLSSAQQVVPHFITHVLPTGMAGLVIAGLFAATMGSLAAGFNSLSTASTMDFYLRFRRGRDTSDTANLKTGRWSTLLWGVGCTLAALMVGRLGGVVEIMGKINSFFSGPLIGMFLLGLLTRRANSFGVLAGAIIGTLSTWLVSLTDVSWLWYGPVGCAITWIAGYGLSYLRPALTSEHVVPLTVWHKLMHERAKIEMRGR
jgi:SSS family transporter